MTEEEARHWVKAGDVPRGTVERLERLAALVAAEQAKQNLVAASTLHHIWSRHIVDSLQLLPLAPAAGWWLDIGTGAGFPGLAIAAATEREVVLVEPRRRRAEFLHHAAEQLGVAARVRVHAGRIETMPRATAAAVISARAVARLDQLFTMAARHADGDTAWLCLKGRTAAEELAAARETWHGAFTMVPSITDPDAAILVARRLRPRTSR